MGEVTKGRPSDATICIAPTTLAAPPMSARILSIFDEGFREIPPVSKVTPLPAKDKLRSEAVFVVVYKKGPT